MGATIVRAEGLTRTFARRGRRRAGREVRAVVDASFAIEAGERVAFIGPNGAGKSTTIKMLTGILHPTAGTARVLDLVPWQQRRTLTRRIGSLFGQRSQLWQELSARQSLHMLAAIHGLPKEVEARRIVELGELLDAADLLDQPVRTLSLGQRMRCELAATMLHEPAILFLDEPSIGLDLVAKRRFRELLVKLNTDHGTTIFLTSHDVADIEFVANRAIVINHGSVIHDGPVAEMRRTLLATKVVEVDLDEAGAAPALAGVTVVDHQPSSMRLEVDTNVTPVSEVVDVLLRTCSVADLTLTDPPLDQVIEEIYGRVTP